MFAQICSVDVTEFTFWLSLGSTTMNLDSYRVTTETMITGFASAGIEVEVYTGNSTLDITESFSLMLQDTVIYEEDFVLIEEAMQFQWGASMYFLYKYFLYKLQKYFIHVVKSCKFFFAY